MKDVRQGGCLCGDIRYEVDMAGHKASICHCTDCQKNSGSPFMAFFLVATDKVKWLSEPTGSWASSDWAFRRFCKTCGTPITWEANKRPERITISLGTLDNPHGIEYEYELYTRSRLEGIQPIAGAIQYEADNG